MSRDNFNGGPELSAIRSEVMRVEEMLEVVSEEIDFASETHCASLELYACRSQLRAYWLGLAEMLGQGSVREMDLWPEPGPADGFLDGCNPDQMTLN
ncbi:MAG TPA: hypothetical protein VFY29_14880 [Terriglobia bacterium]|nr:hypothetical protein [Terriglobia bacterium]